MGFRHGRPILSFHIVFITVNIIVLAFILPEITAQTISSNSFVPPDGNLLQASNVSDRIKKSGDTVRVDPLDHLKKYRGGFDITNKHYWSSTIFTGIYGYAIGVLWLLCGVTYGGYLLISHFCFKDRRDNETLKKRSHCHKQCYLFPILLAIFLTLLAIVASGLVLGGNARFHSEAKSVVNIIIDTANEASESIFNTTGAMKEMRDNIGIADGNAEVVSFITSTSQELDSGASNIQRQARKNRRLIDRGLKIVYVVTTVTISLNLVAVMALSVCGILRLRRALYMLITLCWFLTFLCWLLFGMYYFLDKFSGDTCTALETFQQNPNNNSLSSILPCDQLLSAKPVLYDVSAEIYDLVNEVNANISILQRTTFPSLFHVCNPFSEPPDYQFQPENCPANTIRIGDIPKVLKVFACSDESTMSCENGGFYISDSVYKTVEAYTSSIQNLLNAFPGMESLIECQSVKEAFSQILINHCKPLKNFVKMVWAAMMFLSLVMVFLVVLWTIRTRHETYHFSDGSVNQSSQTTNMMELDSVKTDLRSKIAGSLV